MNPRLASILLALVAVACSDRGPIGQPAADAAPGQPGDAGPGGPDSSPGLVDGAVFPDATPPGASFDLTFSGSGYVAPNRGLTLYVALWGDGAEPVLTDDLVIPATGSPHQTVGFHWDEAIVEGHSYELHWYVDRDDEAPATAPTSTRITPGWSPSTISGTTSTSRARSTRST